MKRRLMFVVPSLRGGGAEKVMVTLLKYLDRSKFTLILVLLSKEGKYIDDIPNDVETIDLKAVRVRHSFISLVKVIRKVKPDVVFSTQGHLNIGMIALKPFIGKRTKLIVREANTVSEIVKIAPKPKVWRMLYKFFYRRADVVICQSKYMMEDLLVNFKIPTEKLCHIYNPVDIKRIEKLSQIDSNPFERSKASINVVAVGRLVYQKGFDRLIESVPKLMECIPDAKLWIIGEGDLKEELVKKRDDFGLSKKIELIDFQENPYKWLKNADLFVLPSYYEGLPNVLLEAIACECPVIALEHPGGTKEIMEITGQEDRYIQSFDWQQAWLAKPDGNIKDLLSNKFQVSRIVKEYESQFI
ncbi:glycosyltransferase [Bacillus massiliigorillae]|uniref:glycosyltransferase n=1 Tax=Bacillus massiliigorillae TaxID=1243664 RepID=UPI00039F510C|nr:glycosyltransferase [Bacillus massiliigorillae]